MELSDKEIKQKIADGEIIVITLDTSIFDGNGNRFEEGYLAQLSQFVTTPVLFVISDVVEGEVIRHVTNSASEARTKVLASLKDAGNPWQISFEKRAATADEIFGTVQPEEIARRRFSKFKELTSLYTIESAGQVDITKMLGFYFAGEPPFGKGAAKKNEFPDAIALMSLESWAKAQNHIMLAVSKDNDWKNFGKTSTNIVVVDDLPRVLNYFNQSSQVLAVRLWNLIQSGNPNIDSELTNSVEFFLERTSFIPQASSGYQFLAEMEDIRLMSVSLDEGVDLFSPFRVISRFSETNVSFEAEIDVEVEFSADFSFSINDSVDDEDFPIGSAHGQIEKTLTLIVILTFEGDFSNEVELISAEVVRLKGRNHEYIDFGDLGPDFEHSRDPDDTD